MSISHKGLWLALLFIYSGARAQADNWDAYIARHEKGIASTTLNMALKGEAPIKDLPFVVVTGVYFRDCMKDGLPTPTEFIRLGMIEDSAQDCINKFARKVIAAGTFTYQCSSAGYYYVSDTGAIRLALYRLFARNFPAYAPTIRIERDTAWSAYLHFLYPNDEVREYMANQKSVMALLNAGDRLAKPREIVHWLYFDDKTHAECFLKFAKLRNFHLRGTETGAGGAKTYKVLINRIDKVDLESIGRLTTELRKKAESCGGSYGGWETSVVR